MAHIRDRHIRPFLDQCLRFSPLVGVVGHRQVGKTTLISHRCKAYHSLDDEESLAHATASASEFIREIAGPNPVAIDEAQIMPKLFPALKEWVRKHKAPGQFLLSGSVRFTSLRSIRESLTGRIITLELLPLTVNELLEVSAPEALPRLHSAPRFKESMDFGFLTNSERRSRARQIETYSKLGGLPGICFVRNDRLRNARLETQINTLLDRDLRIVNPTRLGLGELREILKRLANVQGERLTGPMVSGSKRMNARSLAALLEGLEALFLIRRIPIVGDFKGVTYFFEDIGEHNYLSEEPGTNVNQRLHLLFSLTRAAFAYRGDSTPDFFQFRTRAGTVAPLALRTKDGITGLIALDGDKPNRSENAAAKAFLSRYGNSKMIFFGPAHIEPRVIDERNLVMGLEDLTG